MWFNRIILIWVISLGIRWIMRSRITRIFRSYIWISRAISWSVSGSCFWCWSRIMIMMMVCSSWMFVNSIVVPSSRIVRIIRRSFWICRLFWIYRFFGICRLFWIVGRMFYRISRVWRRYICRSMVRMSFGMMVICVSSSRSWDRCSCGRRCRRRCFYGTVIRYLAPYFPFFGS